MPSRTYRLSLTRSFGNAWTITAALGTVRVSRTYPGRSRREALARFREEFPGLA